jgi:hypothetical protein
MKKRFSKKNLVWDHCWIYEIVGFGCTDDQSAKRETSYAHPAPSRMPDGNIRRAFEFFSNSALSGVLIFEA